MVVDLAHELRAPLTNIRGYLEALSTGVLPSTPNTMEAPHEETMRLSNLTEDLMRLSVAYAARLTLPRGSADLQELLVHSSALPMPTNNNAAALSTAAFKLSAPISDGLKMFLTMPPRISVRVRYDSAVLTVAERWVLSSAGDAHHRPKPDSGGLNIELSLSAGLGSNHR